MVDDIFSIVGGRILREGESSTVIFPYSEERGARLHKIDDARHIEVSRGRGAEQSCLLKVYENLRRYLSDEGENLLLDAAIETGSPVRYHRENLTAIIELVGEFLRESRAMLDGRRIAKGNTLILLSANEPLILSIVPLLYALAAGNRVFLKPSSRTPSVASKIVSILLESGLPPEALNLLVVSESCLSTMIGRRDFDMVLSFGSSKTNSVLEKVAAASSTEFVFEGEGNNWCYVDELQPWSVDYLAECLVHASIKHNGQMCDSLRGVLVHRRIFEELTASMTNVFDEIKIGDPLDLGSDVGALLAGTALHGERVIAGSLASYVRRVRTCSRGSNIFPPALISQPSDECLLLREPLFAPVLWVRSVESVDQAVSFMSLHNSHGLCFSVFTDSETSWGKIVDSISVARLNRNVGPVDVKLSAPWGGVGRSGRGGARCWEDRFSDARILNYGQY